MADYDPTDLEEEVSEDVDTIEDILTRPDDTEESVEGSEDGEEISSEGDPTPEETETTVEEGTDSPLAVVPVVSLPDPKLIRDLRKLDRANQRTCGICAKRLPKTDFRKPTDESCIDCN